MRNNKNAPLVFPYDGSVCLTFRQTFAVDAKSLTLYVSNTQKIFWIRHDGYLKRAKYHLRWCVLANSWPVLNRHQTCIIDSHFLHLRYAPTRSLWQASLIRRNRKHLLWIYLGLKTTSKWENRQPKELPCAFKDQWKPHLRPELQPLVPHNRAHSKLRSDWQRGALLRLLKGHRPQGLIFVLTVLLLAQVDAGSASKQERPQQERHCWLDDFGAKIHDH